MNSLFPSLLWSTFCPSATFFTQFTAWFARLFSGSLSTFPVTLTYRTSMLINSCTQCSWIPVLNAHKFLYSMLINANSYCIPVLYCSRDHPMTDMILRTQWRWNTSNLLHCGLPCLTLVIPSTITSGNLTANDTETRQQSRNVLCCRTNAAEW